MTRDRAHFLMLNIGHFLDHLFMLVFATVAALALSRDWGLSYGELIAYATPGFFAFGLFALPAGWMADRWSRDGMMVVFFVGVGLAAIATGFAVTPLQVGIGLFVIGIFAAIYHPVGLAIVTSKWRNTGMRIAVNGVWGNLGVASAALLTGWMIDNAGWRSAFVVPGVISIGIGAVYAMVFHDLLSAHSEKSTGPAPKAAEPEPAYKATLVRVSAIVFLTTAVSSIVFQSTTFALPKIFDERLRGFVADISTWLDRAAPGEAEIATTIGMLAFVVFAVASLAQVVVGSTLDRFGPRRVFMVVSAMQVVFFLAMPGLEGALAFAVALGFMLGAFGQIPINDFMIGKMASGPFRARIYAVRYVVSFTVLAITLPLIAVVYERWGFDVLFLILAASAAVILAAVACLPARLPTPPAALPAE
ncbi:MAG TPA: MFS transporter [Paracoccaceae bacterium]|nr:MFS transporter [Paracoccaceae bacterium]